MVDASIIWGGIISLYVLSGLIILSDLDTGEPPSRLPNSVGRQQWERRESRSKRRGLYWIGGLVVLLGAWAIFGR